MEASATSLHIHHQENGTRAFMLTHHEQCISVCCVASRALGGGGDLIGNDVNEPLCANVCVKLK